MTNPIRRCSLNVLFALTCITIALPVTARAQDDEQVDRLWSEYREAYDAQAWQKAIEALQQLDALTPNDRA